MTGNPFLPGGGGGGGSSNPFGGSGGGGKPPKPKPKPGTPKAVKDAQQAQNKVLVHLASRLLNAEANQKAGAQQAVANANAAFDGSGGQQNFDKSAYQQSYSTIKAEVQKAFKGMSPEQVRQLAQQGNLLPKQVDSLVHAVQAQTHNPNELVPKVFDWAGRPVNAIKGGLTEQDSPFDPGGWSRGFTRGLGGKEDYSGGATVLHAIGGLSKQDANKTFESWPGWVKVGTNFAVDVALDPTTYVSFGTTAAEKAAARSAAADLAMSRAAEALRVGEITTAQYKMIRAQAELARATGVVTHSQEVQSAAVDLATQGRKALTPELKATLPKALQRKIRGAPGGIKIAGHPIPGTNFLNTPERVAANLTKEDTKIALGRAKAGIEEATKPSAEIVRATQLAYKEAKKNGFDSAHVDARVAKALDVGNTPEDWARLTTAERNLATKLRSQLSRAAGEQRAVGALSSPDELNAMFEARAARQRDEILNNPVVKRYSTRVQSLTRRAEQAQAHVDDLKEAVASMQEGKTVGEFGTFLQTKTGKAGLTSKDINAERAVARLRQRLGKAEGKAAQLRQDAAAAQSRLVRAQTLADQKAGKVVADRAIADSEYLARYATEQAKETMPKVSDAPYSMAGTSLSGRLKTRADEWRMRPASERTLGDGSPFYEPNPSLSTIRRVGEAKRDVAHIESVNALRQIHSPDGVPMALAQGDAGFEQALTSPDWVSINLPTTQMNELTGALERAKGQQVLVRKEIAHDVHQTFDLLKDAAIDGPGYAKFADAVNRVNRLWKGYATVFGPLGSGFVWRNMVGNVFNGFWLTGHMKTVVYDMSAAARIQAKIHQAIRAGEEWSARLTAAETKLVEEADKFRAVESGFFSHGADLRNTDSFTNALAGPLAQTQRNPIARTLGAPFNPDNALLRKSGGVNSAVEDNARLALFMRLRKEGYSAADATRVVHKYLFDYQTIDQTTQAIKRYWNPFFTWTRKNVPLQIETLAKNPGRITSQIHLIEAAQSVNPLDPTAVPQYAQDQAPIGVSGSPGNQLALLPDLPITSAADATKAGVTLLDGLNQWRKTGQIPPNMVQDVFGDLYKGVGPGGLAGMAATGIQIASGKSAFSGAPIDSTTVKTPFYLGGGLPGVPDRIPKSLQTMLESVAPGLSKVRGVAPRDEKDKEKWLTRLASILGGQTIVPANDKSRLSNTYARNEVLDSLRKWLISRGVSLPAGQYESSTASKNPFGG